MTRRRLLLSVVLALSSAEPALAAPVTITILHTNDVHDHLLPHDTKELKSIGGIARYATMIHQLKRKEPGHVLVLDAGDAFQGTPLFNFFHGAADYDAMDAAEFDATTVGNHDLDDGLPNLLTQAAGRHFHVLSSNLVSSKDGNSLFRREEIFSRGGVKIGVFGILGDSDAWAAVAAKNQKGINCLNEIEVARSEVKRLKAQGADIVVALSHSGLDEDRQLASQVSGISVIVGGHSHTKVPAPIPVKIGGWTTYVAQASKFGEYLGRIDLEIDRGKVVSENGYLIPVAGDTPEDPAIAKIVKGYADQVKAKMDEVVGTTPSGLSSEGAYDGDCELGDWAADVMRERTGADVAIMNAGGLRSSILPGSVHIGDLYSVFPFDNSLVTLQMTGALIRRQFDEVAAKHAGMLQVSGMKWRIDHGVATDIEIGGAKLELDRTYTVATINYLAEGNDHYSIFPLARNVSDSGLLLRDVMIDAFRQSKTILPPRAGRVTIAEPLPATFPH